MSFIFLLWFYSSFTLVFSPSLSFSFLSFLYYFCLFFFFHHSLDSSYCKYFSIFKIPFGLRISYLSMFTSIYLWFLLLFSNAIFLLFIFNQTFFFHLFHKCQNFYINLTERRGSYAGSESTVDSCPSENDTIQWKKGNVLGKGAFGIVSF